MDVLQPKPMHGFTPNFQDMFTQRGSRIVEVFLIKKGHYETHVTTVALIDAFLSLKEILTS